MVFVNYPAFVLHDPSERTLADMFWKQLDWVETESYVADGRDYLTFVTRNAGLLDTVYQRLNIARGVSLIRQSNTSNAAEARTFAC